MYSVSFFSVLLLPVSKYERIVMKQDLKVLAEHIEKKVGKAHVSTKCGMF